jgi:ABC-type transport system involved in cytochrome bd biosynthesis fused ATPase/permease subunit
VALLRNLEGYARSIPFVHTARHYIEGAPPARADGQAAVDLAAVEVRIDEVSVVYEGSDIATPHAASAAWPAGAGLALTGANGAGKTSLAMCLVGLLEPTKGRILWGEVDARDVAWAEQRGKIALIPQQGFVSGHRSIAWHLRLLCRDAPSDDALRGALREVGLEEALGHRGDVLDIPAAELSGGERKRMHLARALLADPQIVIFDEPEAGLDAASRDWLRGFVEALAQKKRVVLIAHDENVVPSDFSSLRCVRS